MTNVNDHAMVSTGRLPKPGRVPHVSSNADNGSNARASYVNLNNEARNSNLNNGARLTRGTARITRTFGSSPTPRSNMMQAPTRLVGPTGSTAAHHRVMP